MNKGRVAGAKSAFYTRDQVLEIVPVGRSTLYIMMKAGEFPKPKQLGERSVAWSKTEVDSWIADKLGS